MGVPDVTPRSDRHAGFRDRIQGTTVFVISSCHHAFALIAVTPVKREKKTGALMRNSSKRDVPFL